VRNHQNIRRVSQCGRAFRRPGSRGPAVEVAEGRGGVQIHCCSSCLAERTIALERRGGRMEGIPCIQATTCSLRFGMRGVLGHLHSKGHQRHNQHIGRGQTTNISLIGGRREERGGGEEGGKTGKKTQGGGKNPAAVETVNWARPSLLAGIKKVGRRRGPMMCFDTVRKGNYLPSTDTPGDCRLPPATGLSRPMPTWGTGAYS